MSFDLQPHLKGELIELRPLMPEDWDGLFGVASDPLIWEQHPESDRYKEDVFKVFFREAMACGGALVIIDKKSGHIMVRHGSMVTLRKDPRLKLDGRSWHENTGEGNTTGN